MPITSKKSNVAREKKLAEIFKPATGTTHSGLQNKLLNQALAACQSSSDDEDQELIDAMVAQLIGIGPKDSAEGMLAAQMVATHDAATRLLRQALHPDQTFEGMDMNLKHAEKLLQLFARQMEALTKYRGKGHQKITVERVTVEAGGQAIVGNVSAETGKPTAPQPRQAITDQSGDGFIVPAPVITEREKVACQWKSDPDG